MQDKATKKPLMNDSQRSILDAATDRLFSIIWKEISESYTEEVLSDPKDKYLDLDLFGRLTSTSYDVAHFPEADFLKIVNRACKTMYAGEDFSKTPLYIAAVGLRRIWEGDQNYLRSKDVQLHTIESPLPSGQEIRELLQTKMVSITTTLLQARENNTDFKAKVKYVEGILSKEYIPELKIDYSAQQQKK